MCGPTVLFPHNQEWLYGGGDGTGHYLGWIFFRHSPWTFPLGLNPNYGISINNSIVYSDLIPGLAIVFKIFRNFLSTPFQYFGIWILFAFMMQAIASWKIIGLYSENTFIKSFCCLFFIYCVPFLNILPDNSALSGQFLVLFALYLNLLQSEKRKDIYWTILLIASCLVHFYIFSMVFLLWLANLCDRHFICRVISLKHVFLNIFVSLTLVLLISWQAGYFSISTVGAAGFGEFKSNLLGLFNPNGWSILIKELYVKKTQWLEEPIYFGLGGIIALCFAISKIIANYKAIFPEIKNKIFFTFALFLLFIFSLSNNISIGSLEISFWIPDFLKSFFSILRNSGRMFIPVFYGLLIFICYVIISFSKKNIAVLVLFATILFQIFDLSPGWKIVRENMYVNKLFPYSETPLKSDFWSNYSKISDSIIIIPSNKDVNPDFMGRFLDKSWRIFGRYAAENNLKTNSVYLARYDEKKFLESRKRLLESSMRGHFNAGSIYIINDDISQAVACSILSKNEYQFLSIDGFNVLTHKDRNILSNEYRKIELPIHKGKSGQKYFFSNSGQDDRFHVLCNGWDFPESWGIWSLGNESTLFIPLPSDKPSSLNLEVKALVNLANPQQKIEVLLNDGSSRTYILEHSSTQNIPVPITKDIQDAGYILLNFSLPNATSPKSIGIGNDDRILAVGLVSYDFRK